MAALSKTALAKDWQFFETVFFIGAGAAIASPYFQENTESAIGCTTKMYFAGKAVYVVSRVALDFLPIESTPIKRTIAWGLGILASFAEGYHTLQKRHIDSKYSFSAPAMITIVGAIGGVLGRETAFYLFKKILHSLKKP